MNTMVSLVLNLDHKLIATFNNFLLLGHIVSQAFFLGKPMHDAAFL